MIFLKTTAAFMVQCLKIPSAMGALFHNISREAWEAPKANVSSGALMGHCNGYNGHCQVQNAVGGPLQNVMSHENNKLSNIMTA